MEYTTAACFAALAFLRLPALFAAPTLTIRLQVAGLLLGTFVCLLRREFARSRASSHHGSAGFAVRQEVEDLLLKENTPLPPGSLLLGIEKTSGQVLALPLPMARQHGIIVGGSGTGKSFSLFLPNLTYAQNTSCVVSDPKSELWQLASGYCAQPTRYAPTDPDQSACFNWVPLCKEARMAEICARAIVEGNGGTEKQEAPWPDLEAAFLAALLAHASTLSVPTPLSAYNLFTRHEPAQLMEMFQASPSPVAREQAIIFGQTHERMRGSIVPVVAAKLQFLRDPAVARFCSAAFVPPDLGQLRARVGTIFWCVPEQDMARLRPLSALFFTLLFEQLAAETFGKQGQSIPVTCLLDEFANLGVIPSYDATISLSRGRGVSLWHGVQSLSQLEARYGKANAQTILVNCATKIALHGLDSDTAEYFSRTLGPKTQRTPRRSWQGRRFTLFATGVSDTMGEHARPLMTADEIRRMDTREALVITGNLRPLLLAKYRYGHSPNTAKAGALGAARCQPLLPVAADSARKKPPEPPAPPRSLRSVPPETRTPARAAWRAKALKASHARTTSSFPSPRKESGVPDEVLSDSDTGTSQNDGALRPWDV